MIFRSTWVLWKLYKLNMSLQVICTPPSHILIMPDLWSWAGGPGPQDNCYALGLCEEPLLTHSHTYDPTTLGCAPGPSSSPLTGWSASKGLAPLHQWDPLCWQTWQGGLEGTLGSKGNRDKADIWGPEAADVWISSRKSRGRKEIPELP